MFKAIIFTIWVEAHISPLWSVQFDHMPCFLGMNQTNKEISIETVHTKGVKYLNKLSILNNLFSPVRTWLWKWGFWHMVYKLRLKSKKILFLIYEMC
jgi:hypothetical protein